MTSVLYGVCDCLASSRLVVFRYRTVAGFPSKVDFSSPTHASYLDIPCWAAVYHDGLVHGTADLFRCLANGLLQRWAGFLTDRTT